MELIRRDEDPCAHCGTCLSYCKWDEFERDNPGVKGTADLCRDCMCCYNICARVHTAESFRQTEPFGESTKHPLLGPYQAAWSGWATAKPAEAQDGGVTSLLLSTMLEAGTIDGALVVDRDGGWHPLTKLARSSADVLAASGSKYTTAPSLAPLADFIGRSERLAVVALPCQATALRNLMSRDDGRIDAGRIVAILGIFCYESFRHEGVQGLVEGQFNTPISQITRFDIKKNRLIFFTDGEAEPRGSAPLSEIKHMSWPVCHSCMDFTAELADVSLGAVGSKAGTNAILVRTDAGARIVQAAIDSGALQAEPMHNAGLLEKVAENKRKRRAELEPEELRYLTKQTVRGNFKKALLASK